MSIHAVDPLVMLEPMPGEVEIGHRVAVDERSSSTLAEQKTGGGSS